jgi:hypothetical protein
MSECQHCSQTPEQHFDSAAGTMADYLILTQLSVQIPETKETIDRVLQDWRTHALPECDPLAIS